MALRRQIRRKNVGLPGNGGRWAPTAHDRGLEVDVDDHPGQTLTDLYRRVEIPKEIFRQLKTSCRGVPLLATFGDTASFQAKRDGEPGLAMTHINLGGRYYDAEITLDEAGDIYNLKVTRPHISRDTFDATSTAVAEIRGVEVEQMIEALWNMALDGPEPTED